MYFSPEQQKIEENKFWRNRRKAEAKVKRSFELGEKAVQKIRDLDIEKMILHIEICTRCNEKYIKESPSQEICRPCIYYEIKLNEKNH